MWPMPESAYRRTRLRSDWMRVALVVVALIATALAIGLSRHHADNADAHDASATSIAVSDAVATDSGSSVASAEIDFVGGAIVVCALIVLCCIALGARVFALVRAWTAGLVDRFVPPIQSEILPFPKLAPSLVVLSISRT
jgi:hypothetical protein